MHTNELFAKKTVFSFEVFPPKRDIPVETVYPTLDELSQLHPTGNDGKLQKPIDLSAVPELQNVPAKKTITFRLYAWGSKEGSENTAFRIGKSTADRPALTVQGTAWKK